MEKTEAGFLDVLINTNSVNYQDIMTMPLPAIRLLVQRINHQRDEINKSNRNR